MERSSLQPFTASEAIYHDDSGGIEYHYVLVHVMGYAQPGQVPVAGDDAKEAGWFNLEELLSIPSQSIVPQTTDIIKKGLRLLQSCE